MEYDIIIIGGGPAGLTAGIYGAMANKKVLILEKSYAGGQVAVINNIKNYPGFEEINGYDLSIKMKNQAKNLGVIFKTEEVVSCNLQEEIKTVITHKNTYSAKAVIIATGAYAKSLDVKNEKQFLGKGLSYCATCDGNFFKDKVVTVVGGGNTSMADCLYLSNIAKKIYLVHRRDGFRAQESSLNKVKSLASGENAKIEILTNYVVTNLIGEEKLQEIEILNKLSNEKRILQTDGIFIAIGRKPDTELFASQVTLTQDGFIQTNERMQTSLKNVYAVGDVRNTTLRQIVTACSDGAVAVMDFIRQNSWVLFNHF